uniref:Uncharacterized protein n=1 Tax=Myoviridae sp. ctgXL3 TaxID=2826681 RepID=A0A8S5QQD4_9CAUD|nr:MAG TPA: hypothetical protein [Myoviridae sp. ctgXL3]
MFLYAIERHRCKHQTNTKIRTPNTVIDWVLVLS